MTEQKGGGGRVGRSLRLQLRVKRALDVLGATTVLLILSPVLGCVALAIRVTMGDPVLFRQARIGHLGEMFVLLKFRTMRSPKAALAESEDDHLRMTRVGSLLRKSSLDELPELFNVVVGHMSLVGPRPLLVEYRNRYSPLEWRRHDMPPGLAGPVVAYGRNTLSWEEKFELDVWYVDNWSLLLDFRLMARSLAVALLRRDVNAPEHVTMPRFLGHGKG